MQYETVIQYIELSNIATISHVMEVFDQLTTGYEEDELDNWVKIWNLLAKTSVAEHHNGTVDDFHNLAVSLARQNCYTEACDIIVIGLRYFEKDADLLADFLKYSLQCGRKNECDPYFNILQGLSRETWTWRSFVFSIEYIFSIQETAAEDKKRELEEKLDSLSDEFLQFFPNEERVMISKYEITKRRQSKEVALLELIEAVDILSVKNRLKAPVCAIKIATYYFDKNEFDSALAYIQKAKEFSVEQNPSVESGYIYFLSVLCRIAKFQKNYNSEKTDILKDKESVVKEVSTIYKECKIAATIHRKVKIQRYKELEIQREIIEKLTDIEYDY